MRATRVLKEDHREIRQMLSILEEMCNRLAAGNRIEPKHFAFIIEFLGLFAIEYHHTNEEILINAMRRAGAPAGGTPIDRIEDDHDLLRGMLDQLNHAVAAYTRGDPHAWIDVVDHGRRLTETMFDHMQKEDYIMYYMADIHLSEQEQAELMVDFARLEDLQVISGKKSRFARLRTELEHTYGMKDVVGVYRRSRQADRKA